MTERKELIERRRVLRVYEGFGKTPNDSFDAVFTDYRHERKILDLFGFNGFAIVEGGQLDLDNPFEFCISNDAGTSAYQRDKEISNRVGISMPQTYTPEQALSVQQSIVVKYPNAQRGEDKYLLRSREQKIKFIAWALLGKKLGRLDECEDNFVVVQRILQNVSGGVLEDPFIQGRGWLDDYVFEEFVEPPGKYYTSIRVVVDALGNIHYSQVARSGNKKNTKAVAFPQLNDSPLIEASIPGTNLSMLLLHPESPFYIAPMEFTSNIARGGKPLVLNGNSIVNLTDRKILNGLGINPDRPELPKELIDVSVAIGKEYRRYYPYVGIDYIQRGDGRFFLLEVNKRPRLRPEALGLSADIESDRCETILMQRVIDEISK